MLRLILLALVSAGLYALLALRSNLDRSGLFEQSVDFYVLWTALFVIYALAIRAARRESGSAVFAIIFVTAAGFRTIQFLGHGLDHSEAAVFLHGATPWSALFGHIEASFDVQRVVATAADLGSLLLAPTLLRAAGVPVGAALLHGWNPLVVKEVAGSGRLEAVALFLMIAALRLARTPRWRALAALAYGAALNGPLMFAGTLPLMGRPLRGFTAVSIVLGAIGWTLAFPDTSWLARLGWPPEDFLGGSVTPALQAVTALLVTRNPMVPLALALGLWAAFSVIVAARTPAWAQWPRATLATIGSLLFVMPQVVPWAFVAVGTLAPYSENRGWVFFTATAPLTYLAFGDGTYGFWLGFAQYFAAYAVLIFFGLGSPPRSAAG